MDNTKIITLAELRAADADAEAAERAILGKAWRLRMTPGVDFLELMLPAASDEIAWRLAADEVVQAQRRADPNVHVPARETNIALAWIWSVAHLLYLAHDECRP